jgi:hypothetical protein
MSNFRLLGAALQRLATGGFQRIRIVTVRYSAQGVR